MRCPQFSMKTLLWLVLVVAVAMSSFLIGRRAERLKLEQERAALARQRQEYEAMSDFLSKVTKRQRPEWLPPPPNTDGMAQSAFEESDDR